MEELLIVVLIAAVVALAVRVANVAKAAARVGELDREMDRLRNRVAALEKRSADASPTAPRAADAPPPRPAPQPPPPVAPYRPAPATAPFAPQPIAGHLTSTIPPAAAPSTAPAPAAQAFRSPAPPSPPTPPRTLFSTPSTDAKPALSIEERLGKNWLNKLGIVILVSGLALLLGYRLRTLGPAGKSLTGFFLSAAILGVGLLLEHRERYRIFARALIGGGWALLYFVAFALYHVTAMQVLHSQAVDLVLMLIVAAAMVVHSLRYQSQVVTSLAFLLAFFTVSISHVTLFSLVAGAILAVGLVGVAFQQRWFVLVVGGLIAVYLNHFLWLHRVLPDGAQPGHVFPAFLPSAALLLFYWLLFRLFYIFRIPANDRDRAFSTLNVLLNSAGLLTLLKYQSSHPEWAFRGLLALGLAELALAFLARRRHHGAFVALSILASLFLLAAVPFRFGGNHWSLLWLLQAEMLFAVGLALHESVFRRLGVLSAFAAIAQLLVTGVLPILDARQAAPDTAHHLALTLTCACAALACWGNAEFAARRWPYIVLPPLDRNALRILSYLATLSAAVACWLTLAGPWTILPWLALALLLAFAASRLRSTDLAQQADLLSFAAIARAGIINLHQWDQHAHAPRVLILLAAIAMLYAQMRRRQPAHLFRSAAIEPFYTWAAAALLALLAWYALQPAAVSIAWCLLALTLLEAGLATSRPFLRHEAFLLLGASFVRLFFINIALAPAPRLYTLLPLAAAYAWAYQRLYAAERSTRLDRIASTAAAWAALATVSTLLYFTVRPAWVAAAAAALALAVLLLARQLQRPLFSVQAFVLILCAAGRAIAFNVCSMEPLAAKFTEGRPFTVGLCCALLFAALPIAFSIRRQSPLAAEASPWRTLILRRPEQMAFFAPFAILIVFLAVQLRAGMITVGWSALGLLSFLFALAVGERSFRLAGLGLLLLCVAKILCIDIWHASPADRYITLIVIGAALLLVSFLYSRYRETILELL